MDNVQRKYFICEGGRANEDSEWTRSALPNVEDYSLCIVENA